MRTNTGRTERIFGKNRRAVNVFGKKFSLLNLNIWDDKHLRTCLLCDYYAVIKK